MKKQISDSALCGIILAISGGAMDAYSYLYRGHVFANAQTGNILLFGVNLAERDFPSAAKYLWPVLAFAAGVFLADMINARKNNKMMHWRQISILIEIVILTAVAFIPKSANALANALTSFACGIQVESFRSIRGNSIATTMCIGNLRSGTSNLHKYLNTGEKSYLNKTALYYGIIISFVSGAIAESALITRFGSCAILLSTLLLIAALILMFYNPER